MSEKPGLLKAFVKDEIVLIVEPSQAFSTIYQSILQNMGVHPSQVVIVRKFAEALRLVEEKKPRLLITEYEIEKSFGLELIELQEKQYEQSARISLITTKNSSDSAVAEAAEGQVDGFLLKPFPMDAFQKKISEILNQKLNPSPYVVKIAVGKNFYYSREFAQAVVEFLGAKPLHEKPSMACFHAGLTYQAMGDLKLALAEYKEGRKYQPLHYKCLLAEFEGLMTLANYPEAYTLTEIIRKNYPITSKRLGQMFVASVFTSHFEELPYLYELFTNLDQRSADLINLSSAALLTAGKFMIKQNNLKKSMEYFEIGLLIAGRNLTFLEKIIAEYIKINAPVEANSFLAKLKTFDQGSASHQRMTLQVDYLTLPKEVWAERARKSILDGQGDLEIFQKAIQVFASLGKEVQAESIIAKAVQTQPALRESLYKILENHLPKTANPGV